MNMAVRFLLFDAHSIIFRSYYAFIKNPLRNSRGENTSGIFGFLNTIEKVKKKLTADRICLSFDAPGETFRDRIFKEYKATRPPAPKDIPFQIAKVKEIARYLGIPCYEIEGYEADDVLATLALKLKDYGEIYIVSSDKDLLQLVGGSIYIYDAYRDVVYDTDRVIEKFGIPPSRIREYLALAGDTIDNIPGVPGIGPQRAIEILKKYPNLAEAVKNDKRLAKQEELVMLSLKLTTLDCNVPIEVRLEDLAIKEPELNRLIPILADLEFHSLLKEFAKKSKLEISVVDGADTPKVSFESRIGIGQFNHEFYLANDAKTIYKFSYEAIRERLNDPNIIKIGYDLKELVKNFKISPPIFDIGVVAWLIDPNSKSYKLEDIALKYLNIYLEPTPELISNLSFRLYTPLKERLEELKEMELYKKIEEPLIYVLARMEKRGIRIDIPYLKELSRKIEKEMIELGEKIYKIAGRRFNINSPQQLSQVLFEDLKLTPIKKGKTHYSTDVEVLQQLSLKHQLPGEILRYRELAKVSSTYIEPLINLAQNSRIHTTFNQTGTATGRLSSSNPNIQNIPIRTELGKRLRQGFVAEKGFSLVSADYSQIELRILAHITKDKNLVKAFKENRDIHNHTASLVFNIPESKVSEQQRRMAKVVNYGLIYGMSEYGLAQGLDIPKEEAMQFIQTYYALYPDVDQWRRQAIELAEKNGFTETLFGRKRPLLEINSDNHTLKEAAKRAAINTPIQGTAADIIKLAMIEVEKRLTDAGVKSGLLLSIHDELLYEIEDDRIDEANSIIKEAMENVVRLDVPIEVKIGNGKNWAEAH